MPIDWNGPAFPSHGDYVDASGAVCGRYFTGGLSARAFIAALQLQGLVKLAGRDYATEAERAVMYADALIAQLAKETP